MGLRDPVSSLSHLFTALWAVFALLVMLRRTDGGMGRKAAVIIYGLSMVLLFLMSGLYHGLYYETTDQQRFFQKLDQSAIYLLIAGTNTPVVAFVLRRRFRIWMLSILWGLAFLGVAFQWLLPQAPHAAIVGVCLGLGWSGFIPIVAYYRALGWRAVNAVWIGAGFYSLGGICELCGWPVIIPGWFGAHDFFHLCVTAGSVSFFIFILREVIEHLPLEHARSSESPCLPLSPDPENETKSPAV